MEDSKSALMHDWRNYLRNANGDIFEIIETAIMVAASDHPVEFQIERHKIARALFSSELIHHSECDKYKKQSPKVSHETEDETKIVSKVLTMKEILDKSGDESESVLAVPHMEKQLVHTCKQQLPKMVTLKLNTKAKFEIPKGPVTPEKKVNDQGVAVVLRIKKILDKTGDQCESESVVCDLLTKIESMGLSVKTVEATGIGKPVSALKNHASEKVRQIALKIIEEWKGMVDEWIKKQSSVDCVVQPTSQQVKPRNVNVNMMMMNTETKLEGSEKATKIGNGGVVESSEKLEATKRKLHQGYEKAESMKKKRRIQVIGLHEVKEQGLTSKMSRCIKPGRKPNGQRGSGRH